MSGLNLLCGKDAQRIESALNVTGRIDRATEGASAVQAPKSFVFRKSGYGNFGGASVWTLPEDFGGGIYRLHVGCATGGKAKLGFIITQKASDGFVLGSTLNIINKKVSWNSDVVAGSKLVTLMPGSSVIEVEVKGASSQSKSIDSLFLEKVSGAPGMSATEALLRQEIARCNSPDAAEKLYFIEGADAAAGTVFFKRVLDGVKRRTVMTEYVIGDAAEEMAKELNLHKLPAVLRTTSDFVVKEVCYADGTEKPVYAPAEKVTAEGLTDGRLGRWLTAGCWAGPAGLSLLGLEQENHLLPNEGDSVWVRSFDSVWGKKWTSLPYSKDVGYVIEESAKNSVTWSKGCNYAFAYLISDDDKTVHLEVKQHGFATKAWLNGEQIASSAHKRTGGKKTVMGKTDQGNEFLVNTDGAASLTSFELKLKKGCNRILLKLLTQHDKGDLIYFDAIFADAKGIAYCLTNPERDAKLHRIVRSMKSDIHVTALSNLPHDNEVVDVVTEFKHPLANGGARHGQDAKDEYALPLIPIEVTLEQTLTDYDGKALATRTFDLVIPSVATNRFADKLARGYYAVQTVIRSKESGEILETMRPDGFSVIGGTAAQRQRRDNLKVSSSFYWLTTNSTPRIFPWMARMGVFHNVGSAGREVFEEAKKLGLTLTADFLDPWCGTKEKAKREFAEMANEFTADFKAWNEVDISPMRRDAKTWVARTKLEYEIVKSINPNAVYTGGSLVRVGGMKWFEECMNMGIDSYIDVWDVHAYPMRVNGFTERHIGNSANESGPGVEAECRKAGRENTKDFTMGETGARCSHGADARRWQAATMARMVGWANAAKHYRRIAFLIPWSKTATGGDIEVASFPGEAALYTAGALIDGLPYSAYTPENGFAGKCEAAKFGNTLMFWTNGKPFEQVLPFAPNANPVLVDVVGRVTPLKQDDAGNVTITISKSPVYVLPRAEYEKLTVGRE